MVIYCSDTASLCSVAPSLHELDAELAQYGDLLDVPDEAVDESSTLPVFDRGIVADLNPFSMETVDQLNVLLPTEAEELDQFSLRPTAASLGLKDAIKECLGDDTTESGYHHCC